MYVLLMGHRFLWGLRFRARLVMLEVDMAQTKEKSGSGYTYADYLSWPEDERWEIIDGEAFGMTPAPGTIHQEIASNLHGLLWAHFEGKPCKVFSAPLDVRLPAQKAGKGSDGEISTVVQPDLAVVCDPKKIDERGVVGPPEIVVEILSPSSLSHDQVRKLNLYERHGVREYWVVHPDGSVMIFTLQADGRYGRPRTFDRTGNLDSPFFPGLLIELGRVFPPPPPRVVRESPASFGKP